MDDRSGCSTTSRRWRRLNDTVLAKDLHLFSARPGIQWRQWSNTGSTGHKMFLGQNPPYGVTVTYYLKSALPQGQSARLVVQDASGKTIRELQGPAKAGLNRVGWDTRQESPVPPAAPGAGRWGRWRVRRRWWRRWRRLRRRWRRAARGAGRIHDRGDGRIAQGEREVRRAGGSARHVGAGGSADAASGASIG